MRFLVIFCFLPIHLSKNAGLPSVRGFLDSQGRCPTVAVSGLCALVQNGGHSRSPGVGRELWECERERRGRAGAGPVGLDSLVFKSVSW